MPTLSEIRQKYPQYGDMSDSTLAGALHQKFYSDMPRAEFDAKIGFAAPSTDAPTFGGAGMNTTAGMNEALYGIAGAPVDLMRGAMNLGVDAYNKVTGSDVGYIPEESFGGSRSIAQALGAIRPELDPRNTVTATSSERVMRGVGQGLAATVAPAAVVGGLARGGVLAPEMAQMGSQIFGRSTSLGAAAGDAVAGAAAGGGSAGAVEAAPERYAPLASLAGGLVGGGVGTLATGVPRVVREGAGMARTATEPFTVAGREQMAARRLQEAARSTETADPRSFDAGGFSTEVLINTLPGSSSPLVPGSQPTTFQATGNMGLGALERAAANRDPVPFQQRRADQNAARVGALEGIQPTGAADTVTKALRQRLADIETESEGILARATEGARNATGRVGQGMPPEQAGASLRASLESARAAAKTQERALWKAVDPDGSMRLGPTNIRKQADEILESLTPSAQPLTATESQIFAAIGGYGDVVPLRDITDLQSNLKSAMREERSTRGETTAFRRMSMVNASIQRDLERVLTAKVMREEIDVKQGRMSPDQTIIASLQREQEGFLAGRQADARVAGGGGGPVGYGAGGSAPIPGVRGAASSSTRGSGAAPSNPPVAGAELAPNFDRAALDRLSAANAATRNRAQTFDNPLLSPLRRRPSTTAPYDIASADVAGRIFSPNPKSFEAIGRFRAAVGDEQALPALEGYAVDRLRKAALRDDGTLDPNRLASWRRGHADALRAFPELDARLADAGRASETMAEVAAPRRRALDEAQKGAIGRLIGLDDPADITRTIGGLFGRQDSVQQFARLRSVMGDDLQAREGLRKAVADHIMGRFMSNTEAATSGVDTVKADQFQTFMRQNKPALRAMFSPDEIKNMEAVAADLKQANRSLTAVKIPGQSNTAQDMPSVLGRVIQAGAANKETLAGAAFGGVVSGGFGAIAGGIGAHLLGNLRQAGLNDVDDLIRDALLNPDRARLLLMKVPARGQAMVERSLATRYRSAASASLGMAENERRKGEPLQVTVKPRPEQGAR